MFAMGRGFAVPEEGTMLAEKVVVMVIKNGALPGGGVGSGCRRECAVGGWGGGFGLGEKGVTCPLITI